MIRLPIVSLVFCAACATAGTPRLDEGTRRAAFNFDFSSLETDVEGSNDVDTDRIAFGGDFGWMVAPRTELGVSPSYLNSEVDDGVDTVELTAVAIGPYIRYYFPSDGAVVPFVDGRAAYSDQEADIDGVTEDGDGFLWAAGVGLLAPLSPSVGVEFTARYSDGDFDFEGGDVGVTGFVLTIGLAAFY